MVNAGDECQFSTRKNYQKIIKNHKNLVSQLEYQIKIIEKLSFRIVSPLNTWAIFARSNDNFALQFLNPSAFSPSKCSETRHEPRIKIKCF